MEEQGTGGDQNGNGHPQQQNQNGYSQQNQNGNGHSQQNQNGKGHQQQERNQNGNGHSQQQQHNNESRGAGFQVIIIAPGEDVYERIMEFCQRTPLTVWIISANGTISDVYFHDILSGNIVKHEGEFDILFFVTFLHDGQYWPPCYID